MRRFSRRLRIPQSIIMGRNWRRYAFPLVVLVVAMFVSRCDRERRPAPTGGDRARYHDQSFRVSRVVDGDTFDIDVADTTTGKDFTRIRLWGVDTPELKRGKRAAMHFAEEAKSFAKSTLGDAQAHIVLSPDRTRGKYGRLLAYVFIERGGEMFNELLLEQGLAYADYRFPHIYDDRFKQIEKRARKSGVGLWNGLTREQMPPWRQRYLKATRDDD